MRTPRDYLAEIGRRGGITSRRALDPETARRMVAVREARRAARQLAHRSARGSGALTDTAAAAQAVQDALWRRIPAAEKLAVVGRLTRMVDQLAVEGLTTRHPGASEDELRRLREQLRLGPALAAAVDARRRDRA